MIFWQLFYTFLTIGLFTFGGGYSMVALIQDQVVTQHHWMTPQEFTDMLALSQMTPGPIGINTATYAGYSAVAAAGHPHWAAVAGALLASLAVILLPTCAMLVLCRWLKKHNANPRINTALAILRLTAVGLVAAAALSLITVQTFGSPGPNRHFLLSLAIFTAVLIASSRYKTNPILLIIISGTAGYLLYG